MVVDTSIFIEFLRAKNKAKTTLYNLPDNAEVYISSVTVFELYAGATSETKIRDVELITNDLIILPFSAEIARIAGQTLIDLKKRNQLIEFRDIFIGCTALINQLPLLTLNTKHFQRIPNLEIVDSSKFYKA